MLKTLARAALTFSLLAPLSLGQQATLEVPNLKPDKILFAKPTRMMAAEKVVRVDLPGYAAPCWADVTGDGEKDLLVGQFGEGKIKVYPGLGKGKLGAGKWLMAGGEVAKVDGIW
ncbi:MAG: hypothetical protein V3W41_16235 [Planctomycetota bacterium]